VLLSALVAVPVLAKDHRKFRAPESQSPPEFRQSPGPGMSGGISMDRAIEMVERQYRARVVRADVSEKNGRRVYVLRLLSEEGRVWTVRVDAQSGGMM
jgi:uncharacterized membrane protein YkoI